VKAIRAERFGGPGSLALAEAVVPVPAAGEVLVKVKAAGVNPVDIAVSEGHLQAMMPLTLPYTAGSEVSGIIAGLGGGVQGFAPGDPVYGSTGISGAFAEYALVKAASLSRKPQALSFGAAAGMSVASATATAALNAGAVGPGTRLFIHAAAGSVGSVAVQMARARGAYVIAAASAGNLAYVKALGADEVVDRATRYEDAIRDLDVVIDGFGPEAQERSWGLLRKGGVLLSLVAPPSAAAAAAFGVRSAMVYGTPTVEAFAAANALVDAGKLRILVSGTYPMAQAAEALARVATHSVRGKLVLIMEAT
jgi:NADPH:quinone reductase-like Zn-dependent oxidoreductase